MWMLIASALAWEPQIAGGMGFGAVGQVNRLVAVPAVVTGGSVEVTELIEPIPWLGFGADTFVGFYPSQCDTCEGWLVLRQGLGPVFRTRRGLLQVGGRYSIGTISLQRQSKLRPFVKSVLIVPAGPLDFRIGVWGEGLPAELGLTLELGWWLDGGRLRVSRDSPKSEPSEPSG